MMNNISAQQMRTIWFIVAMIPLIIVAFLVSIAALILLSPLIVYGKIKGIHMKNPWSSRNKYFASNRSFDDSAASKR